MRLRYVIAVTNRKEIYVDDTFENNLSATDEDFADYKRGSELVRIEGCMKDGRPISIANVVFNPNSIDYIAVKIMDSKKKVIRYGD